MARRKRKTGQDDAFSTILGFVDVVDATFERLTGKSIPAWLEEFRQPPRELPSGETAASSGPEMPLADAYAVLGLPPTASIEDVKRNYRNLANIFHPDKGGYDEAMRLLNQAYARVKKGRKAQ